MGKGKGNGACGDRRLEELFPWGDNTTYLSTTLNFRGVSVMARVECRQLGSTHATKTELQTRRECDCRRVEGVEVRALSGVGCCCDSNAREKFLVTDETNAN